ncbi:hypothetical protein ACIQKB_35855 [Streptomyces sp. NPDC092046]|uniref:hypothetical protein n=1 Tax=Streptomyces sp. NPDC092046 TaxID=3366009 RepID=UPI00382152DC
MTITRLPRYEPPAPQEDSLTAEESAERAEVLAQAARTGRSAAEWMRALPLAPGDWVAGPLADAVEAAMSMLDPDDRDDVDGYGQSGVSESVRETLGGLIYCLADTSPQLSPQQQAALVAVVSCVRDIPRALANDPQAVIYGGELTTLCTVIEYAIKEHD